MTDKNLGGRPPKHDNSESMQVLIDQYFSHCSYNRMSDSFLNASKEIPTDKLIDNLCTEDRHPTLSGMGLVLDITRETLSQYNKTDLFSDTIKKGKARVEAYNEQKLHMAQCTGVIFNLKNNFGWTDKQETEIYGKDGGPIQTKSFTELERAARVDEILDSARKRGTGQPTDG